MGGEKNGTGKSGRTGKGSPPHGRGKGLHRKYYKLVTRITPAWAGKSYYEALARGGSRDHPRMGGEKLISTVFLFPPIGSPPHGRGKGFDALEFSGLIGITPAWAGKRKRARAKAGGREDHPRMGGEKCVPVSWATGPAGSPPHGRGKAPPHAVSRRPSGITPAWAGKR